MYLLLGNTLTVIIMRRKEFSETFHKLLITLAITDNIFIITALFALITRLSNLNKEYPLLPCIHLFQNIQSPWPATVPVPLLHLHGHDHHRQLRHGHLHVPHTGYQVGLWPQVLMSIKIKVNFSIERYFGICFPIQSRVGRRRRAFVYILPVFVGRSGRRRFFFFLQFQFSLHLSKITWNWKFWTSQPGTLWWSTL